MKWYDSIKVKLIGFLMIISLFFLFFLISSFSLLKESLIEKRAIEKARLSTISLVNRMTDSRIKMEESVIILASVMGKAYQNREEAHEIILNLMYTMGNEYIPSGGVWYAPYQYDRSKKDAFIFFRKTASQKFTLLEKYTLPNGKSYREMEFYVLGKQLKKGETFWTKVYRDPVTKVKMLSVVSPIYQEKRFLGVASIDMEVEQYQHTLHLSKESYVMVLDRTGTFIAKSARVRDAMRENNIAQEKNAQFHSILMPILQQMEEKRKYRFQYSKKAQILAQSSFEIDKEDADRIVHILHHRHNALEVHTFFVANDALLNTDSVLTLFYFPDTGMYLVVGMTEEMILADINKHYNMIIWITFLTTLLVTLLGYLLLKRYFVAPLESVNKQLENSMLEDGHYRFLDCEDKGEIGQLVYNLNFRTLALEDAQRREKEEIQKRLTNEKLLIQQSKMAAMGEMMDAVAHQWKQPLNALSMYSEIIKSDFSSGEVDQKYIDEFSQNIHIQIEHMVDTLDEFRSFFRPNKEKERFSVSEIIDSVLFLTKDEFLKNRITVKVECEKEIRLQGSKNEFKHLILNIINNAKDAFNDNGIEQKRMITICLLEDEKGKKIEISDNAGGIPESIIDEIFKANVTTKEEGKGTGIGLYMSTQIAQKYGAKLMVENIHSGACFTILFEGD